jgi:hypothetical protein
MIPQPGYVALIGVCPHCHESVEMMISKKQAKLIFKSFKLNIKDAQLFSDRTLELELKKGVS